MNRGSFGKKLCGLLAGTVVLIGLAACPGNPELPTADFAAKTEAPLYRIGPLDSLEIFVWRNDDLSRSVTVRPDGRITVPLVEDLYVTDRTPTELAREIEKALADGKPVVLV